MIIILLVGSITLATVSAATSSIEGELFNKVFDINLTSGADFLRPDASNIRREYNNKIANNTEEKRLSLYDRFGGEIYFIPYYGEKKIELTIKDNLYEKIKENNDDFSFKLSDAWVKDSLELNTEIYENRPRVISEQERKNGAQDPRREHFTGINTTGGSAALGNLYLSVGNLITRTVMWLSGNGLFLMVDNAWNDILTSSFWKSLSEQILIFLPILSGLFVIFILISIINIIRAKESITKTILGIINYIIAFSIIIFLLINPNAFSNITRGMVMMVDNLFAVSINSVSKSEVCISEDLSLVTEAAVWEKAIFTPWCKGMFDGKTYPELYTQFSTSDSGTKLYQTKDNIFEDWDDGTSRYNSSYHTGDIKIPLGGNGEYYTKNWGALAWSTQSIYHIDAVSLSFIPNKWPSATTTPNNPNIYVDNFRWLDAKLNISPEYINPDTFENDYYVGKKIINGKRIELSKAYNENFVICGMEALWMSILLLPLCYPILKRTISIVQIISLGFMWIIRSFKTMINPGNVMYSNMSNIKKVFKPVYHYFWWSVLMFILVTIYISVTGSLIGNILYLSLSLVLIRSSKPIDNYRSLNYAINRIKLKTNAIKNDVKNKINNFKNRS